MKKSKFLFALRLSLIPLSIFGMFFVPSLKIAIVLLATLTAVLAYPFWQKFKTQRALVVAVALTFFLIGSKILITESATNKTVKNNSTAVDGLIDDYLRDSLAMIAMLLVFHCRPIHQYILTAYPMALIPL